MSPLSIPYHLIIPLVIFSIALLWIFISRNKRFKEDKKWFWTCAVIFIIIYLVIVGSAAYEDIRLQIELNAFDLDGDSFFSSEEQTAEQEEAMDKLTNDFGRNISFIAGLIIAIFITLPLYYLGRIKKDKEQDISSE